LPPVTWSDREPRWPWALLLLVFVGTILVNT
jgi:hypothetical protein